MKVLCPDWSTIYFLWQTSNRPTSWSTQAGRSSCVTSELVCRSDMPCSLCVCVCVCARACMHHTACWYFISCFYNNISECLWYSLLHLFFPFWKRWWLSKNDFVLILTFSFFSVGEINYHNIHWDQCVHGCKYFMKAQKSLLICFVIEITWRMKGTLPVVFNCE